LQPLILASFKGTIPRIDPTLLPAHNAQIAKDCDLSKGVVSPSKRPLDTGVLLLGSTQSVFRYNRESNGGEGFWLQFDADVSVVASPIEDDPYRRVYYTGIGAPKFTAIDIATAGDGPYPTAAYDLGIQAPLLAPSVTGPIGDPPDGGIKIPTSYQYTVVDKYGAEGPPSDVSVAVDRWDGDSVELSNLQVPAGNFVIESIRIYRIEYNGLYQRVATIPATQDTFSDTIESAYLGHQVPSDTWLPPNSKMTGLTELPNGVLMGYWDNTIAFSEPYQPHAWPIEYRHALGSKIVGAAVSDVGVIVVTESKPYFLVGSHPSSFSEQPIDAIQAGVSKRSVVDLGSVVVFATTEGLVGPGGVYTAGHIDADEWKALKPETIHGYRWQDRYLGFYDSGSEQGAFTFTPSEGFIWYSSYADYGYSDPKTGDVYLMGSGSLLQWATGTDIAYQWKSKPFENSWGDRPGVAKIRARSYPVTFNYYADGVLRKSLSVASPASFRLPTAYHSNFWEVEVTGLNSVTSIQIARSKSEL